METGLRHEANKTFRNEAIIKRVDVGQPFCYI